ncbi:MAG TPA: Ppx/GppA phosphatase family protein [Casimicrobiaceae bacterium]|nr:Ppx/GppA phosphatase family protein [Casimicrobiaceae bacterium]
MSAATLAVVDLGSNSFRLEIGRVEGGQIYRQDTWRETLRFGAGLDRHGRIKPAAMKAAIECLQRFHERLSGVHPSAVRAVATNTFRVAKNAREFLPQAERALGFPIDVIGGHEEARLIYLGVAHVLPPSAAPRLVIDIGGGSTELIIGRGLEPERLESLRIGCVGMTQRFFPNGKVTAGAFDAAETAARVEIEAIASEFGPSHWRDAFASSGTAAALAEILEQNAFSPRGITPVGLARLKKRLIQAGNVHRLHVSALKPERAPVLAGGLAIMSAAVAELRISRIDPVGGALRLGVLYDLLGRTIDEDVRKLTVERFVDRYRIERAHAARVAALAAALCRRVTPVRDPAQTQLLTWASLLHEIGMSVAHLSFHKHGAYILQHADMPGFSAGEQSRLAILVYGCRGGLAKVSAALSDPDLRAQLFSLRLAVLFHHARTIIALPRIELAAGGRIGLGVSERWLAKHPLTAHLLAKERRQWKELGHPWKRL